MRLQICYSAISAFRVVVFLLTSILLGCSVHTIAQDKTTVVATVNEFKITRGGVLHELKSAIGDVTISSDRREKLEQAALTKLVNQMIVLDFLHTRKIQIDPSEIKVQLELISSELAKVDQTLDDKLAETGQSLEELKIQLDWRSSWKEYLEKKLSDDFLEGYYDRHRREFDGTELHVAHILFKLDANAATTDIDLLKSKAKDLHQKIKSKTIDWTEAAATFSDAPTAKSNGTLGWIRRTGPMPRSFTEEAFKLQAGQISEPVTTTFGVHLIKCLEVKPGKIGWRDAYAEVRKDATRALFDAIVNQHKQNVDVTFRNN